MRNLEPSAFIGAWETSRYLGWCWREQTDAEQAGLQVKSRQSWWHFWVGNTGCCHCAVPFPAPEHAAASRASVLCLGWCLSLPPLRARARAAKQVESFVLVILPFTYRVVNGSWEADSFQRLLHSDAVAKQAATGKKTSCLETWGQQRVSCAWLSLRGFTSRRLEAL